MLNKEDRTRAEYILKDIRADVAGKIMFSIYRFKRDLLWTSEKLKEVNKELEYLTDSYTNLEDDHREALLKIEQLEGRA